MFNILQSRVEFTGAADLNFHSDASYLTNLNPQTLFQNTSHQDRSARLLATCLSDTHGPYAALIVAKHPGPLQDASLSGSDVYSQVHTNKTDSLFMLIFNQNLHKAALETHKNNLIHQELARSNQWQQNTD